MLGIRQFKNCGIDLYKGDITEFVCDAMINAANSELRGNEGVNGAIHKIGGPIILNECKTCHPHGCPIGHAVVTSAGSLPAKWVIHAVGPIWINGFHSEADLLKSAYRTSLECSNNLKIRHIAFPSISTGASKFPYKEAAHIAMNTIKEFIEQTDPLNLGRITFVLFNMELYNTFQTALFNTFEEGVNNEASQ